MSATRVVHLDPVQVVAELDPPVEFGRGQRTRLLLLAERDTGHIVGQHNVPTSARLAVAAASCTDE